MSHSIRNWVLTGWVALVVGVLALHVIWPQPGIEGDYRAWALGLMAFPVAAALILARRPGNGVGLTLGVVGTASLLIFGPHWYAVNYVGSPLSRAAELVSEVAAVLQFAGIVALLYLFPTGRPLNPRHARVFRAFVVVCAGLAVLLLFAPGPMSLTGRANPVGLLPDWARAIWEDSFAVIAVFGLVGIGSLVMRWRSSGSTERAQLRWFLAAAVAAFVGIASLNAVPGMELVGFLVAVAAFWSLPAAVVVAVTRYRLYEIDRLLSRTVSYALVAGWLAAVYATIAIGLPQALPVTLDSSLLVAAATLAAAALFNPVRRRMQRLVDRRFNRVRYDAKREMDRLASRLRTELDLDELTDEILDVVTTTMQPTMADVWIRDEGTP